MKYHLIIVVASLLLITACDLSNGSEVSPGQGNTAPVVSHIYQEQTDGSHLFETNDGANTGGDGTTFFCYDPLSKTFPFEVKLQKSSGNANGGYGLIFQRLNKDNFWVFNIDVQGKYYLAKVVDQVVHEAFSDPAWRLSGFLKTGYGSDGSNTIKISFDGTKNYEISQNGNVIVAFTDTISGDAFTGGCFGIDTIVMPAEQFPTTPVSTRFWIIQPLTFAFPASPPFQAISRSIGAR